MDNLDNYDMSLKITNIMGDVLIWALVGLVVYFSLTYIITKVDQKKKISTLGFLISVISMFLIASLKSSLVIDILKNTLSGNFIDLFYGIITIVALGGICLHVFHLFGTMIEAESKLNNIPKS